MQNFFPNVTLREQENNDKYLNNIVENPKKNYIKN